MKHPFRAFSFLLILATAAVALWQGWLAPGAAATAAGGPAPIRLRPTEGLGARDASPAGARPESGGRRTALGGAQGTPAAGADLSGVLRSLQAALEAQDPDAVRDWVQRAVSDLGLALDYVARLADPGLEPGERGRVLLLLGLLVELDRAARLEAGGEALVQGWLGPIYARVLADLGTYFPGDAEAILELLAAGEVLGGAALDSLVAWLPHLGGSEAYARLVVDLALAQDPPRHDLIGDLARHGEGNAVLAAAEELARHDPSSGLELAHALAADLPPGSELLPRLGRLVAALDEPERAFDFVLHAAGERGWVELLEAADALETRGLHGQAIGRYLEAEDFATRRLLVTAAAGDADFMEHVLRTEDDPRLRDMALVKLSYKRSDAATGALLAEAIELLLGPPAPGASPRPCSPEAVLGAVTNLLNAARAEARSSPSFARLAGLLGELARSPGAGEAIRGQATELLRKMDP